MSQLVAPDAPEDVPVEEYESRHGQESRGHQSGPVDIVADVVRVLSKLRNPDG